MGIVLFAYFLANWYFKIRVLSILKSTGCAWDGAWSLKEDVKRCCKQRKHGPAIRAVRFPHDKWRTDSLLTARAHVTPAFWYFLCWINQIRLVHSDINYLLHLDRSQWLGTIFFILITLSLNFITNILSWLGVLCILFLCHMTVNFSYIKEKWSLTTWSIDHHMANHTKYTNVYLTTRSICYAW